MLKAMNIQAAVQECGCLGPGNTVSDSVDTGLAISARY